MRIRYNALAMNTARNLNIVWKQQASLAEQLSSGNSIHRAADNAAGLKISEKMRAQIRGLDQASKNAQDGISLLQTADGALNEVHSILQRLRELTVQASNDTNVSADRIAIQEEVDQLLSEVDRIAETTEFNTRKIFDGSFAANSSQSGGVLPYQQVGASKESNIFVFEVEDEYETTQTANGTATLSGYENLKTTLENQIVPQAVNTILETYDKAFGYLKDCSIGIGLKLYEESSTTLAYAQTSLGWTSSGGDITYQAAYTLAINMTSLDMDASGNLTEESRTDLETTILHEMIHTFMYEATTNGALGIENGSSSSSNKYPGWFMEGMAQTASGGYANCNDWVNIGMGITSTSTADEIAGILKNSTYKLTSNTSSSQYGTGYLACMYLGMLASGESMTQSNVTAENITNGLDHILFSLISGSSLDNVMNEISGGTYTSASNFASTFGDTNSATFVKYLTENVGEGNGSLMGGDFAETDLLDNQDASTTLFDLNTSNTEVLNSYPEDVNVLNGGGTTATGAEPVPDYTTGNTPTSYEVDINVSRITTAGGQGYTFDGTTLTITNDGTYNLTGTRSGIEIKIADGVKADLTLQDLKVTSSGTALDIGSGSEVTMKVKGTNTLTSTDGPAIEVVTGSTLTITGDGTLNAIAESGSGSATIGSRTGEAAGTIGINGDTGGCLVVNAQGDTNTDSIGAGTGGSGESVSTDNVILVDSNGESNVYGNVVLGRNVNIEDTDLIVNDGATMNVASGGSITSSSGTANIMNRGTIENHGSIGTVTNEGSGSVVHYISNIKKSLSKPSTAIIGESLQGPPTSTVTLTYNGGEKVVINGDWSIKDSDGNTITDPSSVTVEEGDEFTYSVSFALAPEYELENNGQLFSYININNIGGYEQVQPIGSVDNKSVTYTGVQKDGDRKYILSYTVTAQHASAGIDDGGFHLQVGANSGQGISLDFGKISVDELGLDSLSVMSHTDAEESITKCDDAITKVSSIRSRVGAYQNRLEFTIRNLDNTAENLQEAESRIRDLDIAEAMVQYAKNQILIQAGEAMLSQANRSSEGILNLIR